MSDGDLSNSDAHNRAHRYDNVSSRVLMDALDVLLDDQTGDLDYVTWRVRGMLGAARDYPHETHTHEHHMESIDETST
jgi:hypothetical protein